MMWLETLFSALLLLAAFSLLALAPAPATPMVESAAQLQSQDRAALLAEWGSDAGPAPLAAPASDEAALAARVFPRPEPFCYRWVWVDAQTGLSSPPSFSAPACAAVFAAPHAWQRSLSRCVWRASRLQFLRLDQAPLAN